MKKKNRVRGGGGVVGVVGGGGGAGVSVYRIMYIFKMHGHHKVSQWLVVWWKLNC